MSSRRRAFLKFLIPSLAALVCFGALEIAVRALCRVDVDGEARFRETRLKPYRLPVRRAERQIADYLASKTSALVYDADLGWSQRPGVADHNDAGFITTGPTPPRAPSADRLRIALFGDSFTQGNFRTGWWRVLEEQLNASGVQCEVLNFGVGGYGMDQAVLRWERDGAPWQPQVVVFGFFAEDCYRNVNTLRLLRDPDSGIPFMKPRFVPEGDGLRLVNSPTPPPDQVPATLRGFAQSPLADADWFFRPNDFRMNGWRWSRLAALVEAKATLAGDAARAEQFFRPEGEAAQIALRLMRRMRAKVEMSGARFVIAHLPGETELANLRRSGRMPHQALYEALRSEHDVIALEPALLAASNGKDLRSYFHDGHYMGEFNAIVGKQLAEALARHR